MRLKTPQSRPGPVVRESIRSRDQVSWPFWRSVLLAREVWPLTLMLAHRDIATSLLLVAAAFLFCGREAATKPLFDDGALALEVVLTKHAELTDSLDRSDTPNPLWTIPLASLSQTRERPLFSPSRRP